MTDNTNHNTIERSLRADGPGATAALAPPAATPEREALRDSTEAEGAAASGAATPPAKVPALYVLDQARPIDPAKFPNPPRLSNNPPATLANTAHVLQTYGITPRYNVIRKKLHLTMPGQAGSVDNFDAVAMTQVESLAMLNGIRGKVGQLVLALSDRHLYNPVADWIHSRPWDGRDRLGEFYASVVQREDYPQALKEALLYRWMLSAVAAALKPSGFRCRGVLTLQGPQGLGKTAWVRALVPDGEMSRELVKLDHHLDPGIKDSILNAIECWIVELGELESSFRRDIARLKGFLTADKDKIRRPYAAVAGEFPRRTVFCATVNDANFLVDPTGNNRWWTIPITAMNAEHGVDMQQLFAQLAVDFGSGAQWWLTADEERQLEERNRDHRAVSALHDRVLDWLERNRPDDGRTQALTAIELLRHVGIQHPTNGQCREAGAVMREVIGPSKRIRGRDRWHVPMRELSLNEGESLY